MFKATLYKNIKSLTPFKVIGLIMGMLLCALMCAYPSLMASLPDSEFTTNPSTAIGGLGIILLIVTNYFFFHSLYNGVGGMSFPDVNFYFQGPAKNLDILVIFIQAVLLSGCLVAFVLSCQAALLNQFFGFSSFEMVMMILGLVVVIFSSYVLGCIFAVLLDNTNKKKWVALVFAGIDVLGVLSLAINYLGKLPSISIEAIKASGIDSFLQSTSESGICSWLPISGWFTLIVKGIRASSMFEIIAGIVLSIATMVVLLIIFSKINIENCKETMIANAMKAKELEQAKRAGVEITLAKTKVGKEKLSSGEGASALSSIITLDKKRTSHNGLFSRLQITYRLFTIFFAFVMRSVMINDEGGDEFGLIYGTFMILMFGAYMYGKSKSILEFSKPYFYMIPEPASKKLFALIKPEIMTMIVDSVVMTVVMYIIHEITIPYAIAMFFLIIAFSFFSEVASVFFLRVLKPLGRIGLLIIKSLSITIFGGFILVFMGIGIGNPVFLIIAVVAAFVVDAITMLLTAKVIERMEM